MKTKTILNDDETFFSFINTATENWIFPDSGSVWQKTNENEWTRTVPGNTQLDNYARRNFQHIGCDVKF